MNRILRTEYICFTDCRRLAVQQSVRLRASSICHRSITSAIASAKVPVMRLVLIVAFCISSLCITQAIAGESYRLSPPLEEGVSIRQHRVTPDGKTVLYIADVDNDGKRELYKVDITGGSSTRLSQRGRHNVRSFKLSSDGSKVVYMALDTDSDRYHLYGVQINEPLRIIRLNSPLQGARRTIVEYKISPDGGDVVYLNYPNDSTNQRNLYTTQLDFDAGIRVTYRINPPLDPNDRLFEFYLSQDSRYIVYSRDDVDIPGRERARGIYRADYTGATHSHIAGGREASNNLNEFVKSVQLTSNSEYAVYLEERPGKPDSLWRKRLSDDSAPVRLVGASDLQVDGDVDSFQLSPDGKFVVFAADKDTDDVIEYYTRGVGILDSTTIRKLNTPVTNDQGDYGRYRISRDSQSVVFLINGPSGEVDLYRSAIDGLGTAPTKLNAPLPSGTRVSDLILIGHQSRNVVYSVWRAGDDRRDLFRVPILGGRVVNLTAELPPSIFPVFPRISPDESRVVLEALPITGRVLKSVSINGGKVTDISQASSKVYSVSPYKNIVVFEREVNGKEGLWAHDFERSSELCFPIKAKNENVAFICV